MIIVNSRFLTQPITGVQRFAIEISKQLKSIYKNDILFISPKGIIDTSTAKELEAQIYGKYSGYLWEQIELPIFLKENGNPLLLNLCNMAPIFYRNKISTIHDITFIKYPESFSIKFKLIYKTFIPLILKTSKHIFTVSEFSKQDLSQYYHININNISVIPNAVNENFFPHTDYKLSKTKYILAASSVKKNKNFIVVLESFLSALKQAPDIHLFIIGDVQSSSFKKIDISKYKRIPQIHFLGRVTDNELIKYYSNARAFIFPSLYEGFGIPVIEAQACGCPVIAANTSSLPEVLKDSALLCNPHSISDFTNCILQIFRSDELYNSLRKKGEQNKKRFSWNKSATLVSNHIKVYSND